MTRQLFAIVIGFVSAVSLPSDSRAQSSRASVPASEVNGTFQHNFTGRFKGTSSEIRIWALGKGKLRVAFDLIYPYVDGTGELSANLGEANGIATIDGDTAVYRNNEFGDCVIT